MHLSLSAQPAFASHKLQCKVFFFHLFEGKPTNLKYCFLCGDDRDDGDGDGDGDDDDDEKSSTSQKPKQSRSSISYKFQSKLYDSPCLSQEES